MTAAQEFTPSEYIQHHLTFFTAPESGGFWSLNVDTVVTSIVLGVLGLGFLWWVVRGATSGVPGKRQAFVEWLIEFVDREAQGIFHRGDRSKFVAPAALSVFVWVTLMNSMDFLPVDVITGPLAFVGLHHWRPVPTADVNATFALSISVLLMSLYFGIAAKGLGGWLKAQVCAPFGRHPLLWPANLLFNLVEYFSKTLSHSLRLFGNIYAGEILFFLLWLWAATGAWGAFFGVFFGLCWEIFHVLIVLLQAYIFMMLTIVYIAMAHEHH